MALALLLKRSLKRKNLTTLENLVQKLREQNHTLALAESCTGGLLSAQLTQLAGVSQVFQGAVVAYSNQTKINLLDVPLATLEKHGAVSDATALAMAQGAQRRLQATWAVAITGIAGPEGGSNEKPVGTVHFAVVGPSLAKTSTKALLFTGSRVEIQQKAAAFAAEFLFENVSLRL